MDNFHQLMVCTIYWWLESIRHFEAHNPYVKNNKVQRRRLLGIAVHWCPLHFLSFTYIWPIDSFIISSSLLPDFQMHNQWVDMFFANTCNKYCLMSFNNIVQFSCPFHVIQFPKKWVHLAQFLKYIIILMNGERSGNLKSCRARALVRAMWFY